jgi:chemotaxis protein methyltransferase CheR
VSSEVRALCHFGQLNLVDAARVALIGRIDVIFCRNVLIYFSDAMIGKVVRIFHEVLAPGGFLFLGHAESLSRITDLFTPIRFQGAMIYQKAGSSVSRAQVHA